MVLKCRVVARNNGALKFISIILYKCIEGKREFIERNEIFFKNNKFSNNLFRLFHRFVYKKDDNLYK